MSDRRWLLTTDFSDCARRAYSPAAHLARRAGAAIDLVNFAEQHAWMDTHPEQPKAAYLEEVTLNLAAEVVTADEFSGLTVTPKPFFDRWTRTTLANFQHEHAYEMVLTATHGWRGARRYVIGSFAERLVRTSSIPVWVLNASATEKPEYEPTSVLVPYNFTATAQAALPVVRFLAERFACRFRLLFVYGTPHGKWAFLHTLLEERYHKSPAVRDQFREMLSQRLPGVDADLETAQGDPYDEIVQRAEADRIDLILLGTSVLLGTVAQNVVRVAPCSVLACPAE